MILAASIDPPARFGGTEGSISSSAMQGMVANRRAASTVRPRVFKDVPHAHILRREPAELAFFDAPVFGPFGQVSQVLAGCLDMIFAPTMLERSRISTIPRLVLIRNFGPRLPLVTALFKSGNLGVAGGTWILGG